MPYKLATRLQNSREFSYHAGIVTWVCEKPEGSEQVEHDIEPVGPAAWHAPHVAARIAECGTLATLACDLQELLGIVERVDIVARFHQEMRVSPLPARHIENPGSNRKREHVDQPRYFASRAFRRKKGTVLEEIVGVESRLPPLGSLFQKNTGSR